MSVYINALKEDLDRVRKNIDSYQRRISEFPLGSLMVRRINGNEYIYLKYRKGEKVVQEYVSPYDPGSYNQLKAAIMQRKQLQQEMKNLVLEEKDMKKALKALGEKNV